MVTGYCVSCGRENKENGKKKVMKAPVIHMTAKGGYMAKGACSVCGTGMCAMMSKANAEAAIAAGEAKKE
jgi:hypothetical protein